MRPDYDLVVAAVAFAACIVIVAVAALWGWVR